MIRAAQEHSTETANIIFDMIGKQDSLLIPLMFVIVKLKKLSTIFDAITIIGDIENPKIFILSDSNKADSPCEVLVFEDARKNNMVPIAN